eukprot:sb/3466788/
MREGEVLFCSNSFHFRRNRLYAWLPSTVEICQSHPLSLTDNSYCYILVARFLKITQEPTETSKQPIRSRYLGHVTGYWLSTNQGPVFPDSVALHEGPRGWNGSDVVPNRASLFLAPHHCKPDQSTSASVHPGNKFYDDVYEKWLPKMCAKYSSPQPDRTNWTSTDEVANGFHNPPKVLIPECLSGPYPSHIRFNLLPRAQGKGMGESLVTCVMESLKQKGKQPIRTHYLGHMIGYQPIRDQYNPPPISGSLGVHWDISPEHIRHLNFYTSLGFTTIEMSSLPANQLFLGKTFSQCEGTPIEVAPSETEPKPPIEKGEEEDLQ